jgi:hypothetical protein
MFVSEVVEKTSVPNVVIEFGNSIVSRVVLAKAESPIEFNFELNSILIFFKIVVSAKALLPMVSNSEFLSNVTIVSELVFSKEESPIIFILLGISIDIKDSCDKKAPDISTTLGTIFQSSKDIEDLFSQPIKTKSATVNVVVAIGA